VTVTTADPSPAAARPPLPLEGIRVLDLTRHLPGPFCTQLLGDFGAEVWKVETPGPGDPTRMVPPFVGDRESALFMAVNRNKQSIALDLKRAGGKRVLKGLAREADVLVEGFRPGVMARLGLGYETLRDENERLIYAAITGYGQTGPLRDRAGHDLNYVAYSGALDMTGAADGPPVQPGVQVADLTGALYAVIGILLALEARRRTGRGQLVDVSMLDGCVSLLSIHALAAFYGQPPVRGRFALSGCLPNYSVYETSDGRHLAVAALEPQFWARAADALGLTELADRAIRYPLDPELSAVDRAVVASRVRERTLAEWEAVFEPVDACVSPVRTAAEALESAPVRARGLRRATPHPTLGLIHQLAPGVHLEDTPGSLRTPPPAHGEQTDALLSSVLGLSAEEIAALRGEGALG